MESEFEKRGLHNWRNLFRKPTLMEWIVLFLLLMLLFTAWGYSRDISVCREGIKHLQEDACKICMSSYMVEADSNIDANSINLRLKENYQGDG